AEAECEPRSVDARAGPIEPQVVAKIERQTRGARTLDRGAADLAVALRCMAVAGREQRAVDRDRQEQRRARDELLAVDVSSVLPRRDRRVHAMAVRRHPEHAEERMEANALPGRGATDAAVEGPRDAVRLLGERLAPGPGRDVVDPDGERLACP